VPSAQPRFLTILARIHSTLSIAPSLPTPSLHSAQSPADGVTTANPSNQAASQSPTAADSSTLTLPGAVELPFVPAVERQRERGEASEDAIVVVGQARARKRKRTGAKGKAEGDGEAKEAKEAIEVEPFDYAAASNILDEGPEPEAEERAGRKKKKQAKGAAPYQYGDFGAPPKAHSQPKSGNVSRTFR